MLVSAVAVLPVFFAQSIDNLWLAVLVIGIAAAAHQAFSANLYTLPSDVFPRAQVGSVIGFGVTDGTLGGMLKAIFASLLIQHPRHYTHPSVFADRIRVVGGNR